MKKIALLLTAVVALLLGMATAQAEYYGESLGESEQLAVANTFQYALENNKSGTAATWNNPDSALSGSTVPLRTFQAAGGIYCREYQQLISIAEKDEQGYGTACRQPDGNWRIVAPDSVHEVTPVTDRQARVYNPRPYRYYDPWGYAYPYAYSYYPRHISFSFGFSHHNGHYYSGNRYYRGYNSHYRGYNRGHFRGHNRSHYRGYIRGHDRGHNKSHYRGHNKSHYRGNSKSHYRGHNKGHSRHLGKSNHKAYSGKRSHKGRSWGHFSNSKKFRGNKAARFNKGGFKGSRGKGSRGRY